MNVLVIDDAHFILKLIAHSLKLRCPGSTIVTRDPLREGLPGPTALRAFDLVVLDQNLGDFGFGLDWLERVGRAGRIPPVVLISADDLALVDEKARDCGVYRMLAKDTRLIASIAGIMQEIGAGEASPCQASL